jgi:hypothetical protein
MDPKNEKKNHNNTVVTCHLMGGLGNQLFQIFTTIAYSIRHKRNFLFAFSEKLKMGIERNTYWDTFLLPLLPFTNKDKRRLLLTNTELRNLPQYSEKNFQYHPIPEWSNEFSFQLHGYFQSYLYFLQEQDMIYRTIRLSKQKEDILKEYSHLFIPNKIHISMHFRLGDYKYKQECHPVLSFSYYFHALEYIHQYLHIKNIGIRVLYFCEKEDNQDVDEKIRLLTISFPDFEFIKVDDTISDWKQLLLMSLCEYNIIANSTFSWWGAYFNENQNKTVFYPSTWFGPRLSEHNTKDLFPVSWKSIPCL